MATGQLSEAVTHTLLVTSSSTAVAAVPPPSACPPYTTLAAAANLVLVFSLLQQQPNCPAVRRNAVGRLRWDGGSPLSVSGPLLHLHQRSRDGRMEVISI
ncbi:hypothetical protein JZ751_006972 [Albula glossodonta]|uniref:Uncharacterized protein n=1 Tax=Albula glossodonta TaxID=121402 RepID=A0A8T2P4C2_9TELE|nr:hypothetical protein JZ751_006972 [Albula glossodonta]